MPRACCCKTNIVRERLITCMRNANFGFKQRVVDIILGLKRKTSFNYRFYQLFSKLEKNEEKYE
jgi:hypothetical protein